MSGRKGVQHTKRPGRRGVLWFAPAVIFVVLGVLFAQSWTARVLLPMMLNGARPSMPDLYVRTGGDEQVECGPVRAEYIPDVRAFDVDPATGGHAQIADACEDMRMSPTLGAVFFSCDPGRDTWNTFMGPVTNVSARGAIWVSNYKNAPDVQLQMMPISGFPEEFDFHPHGITLYEYAEDRARMFILNQRRVASTIEVVDIERTDIWHASYVRTVYHPVSTHTPNALQAVGPNEVYVTNSQLYALRAPPRAAYERAIAAQFGEALAPSIYAALTFKPLGPVWQLLDRAVKLGYVTRLRFDEEVNTLNEDFVAFEQGVSQTIFAKGIGFANGIVSTNDQVIVASSAGPGLYLYERAHSDADDGDVDSLVGDVRELHTFVPLPFLPDNLALTDISGVQHIIVAGHPSARDLEQLKDVKGERRAPSWVVDVYYDGRTDRSADEAGVLCSAYDHVPYVPDGWHIRTLFETNGRSDLAAASSTAVWDPSEEGHGLFFVSSLYRLRPAVCRGMYA